MTPTLHDWGAVLWGMLLFGAGLAISLIGLEVIPVDPKTVHVPMWVLTACGAVFFFPGLLLIGHGFQGIAMSGRRARLQALRPTEPWIADHAWDERRATNTPFGKAFKRLEILFFALFLLTPANYAAFLSGEESISGKIIVGLFDLFLLAGIVHAGYWLLQGLKYGASTLEFETFPYLLGDTLRARFRTQNPLRGEKATVALRYVIERYEGTGRNRKVVRDEAYVDRYDEKLSGGREFPVEFPLPEGDFATRMSDRPPRYWEVEIKAETPGVDFQALFLVPIYSGVSHQPCVSVSSRVTERATKAARATATRSSEGVTDGRKRIFDPSLLCRNNQRRRSAADFS